MPINIELDETVSKDASSAIRRAQRQRLEDAMGKGFAVSQERVPSDEGTLRKQLFDPTWRKDGSIVYGNTANHAAPIEFGTAPFQPPIKPLLEWSERVTGDKGLGFYVALHKIPTEGIDSQPYMRPGLEATKRWLKGNDFGKYLDNEL